jgi:hypothetical protein
MKERHIIFSDPMVRAVLAGKKMQMRLIVKIDESGRIKRGKKRWHPDDPKAITACPYGGRGDRLWVKESWRYSPPWGGGRYRATEKEDTRYWKQARSMPRHLSRITLEISEVRIARLHEISDDDCIEEGIGQFIRLPFCQQCGEYDVIDVDPREVYQDWWESIHGPGSWNKNPLVWCIQFRTVKED